MPNVMNQSRLQMHFVISSHNTLTCSSVGCLAAIIAMMCCTSTPTNKAVDGWVALGCTALLVDC